MYFALAANEGFKLRSIDIRAAFLQAKGLDREVYMEPPKDVKKEGKIWKLKKTILWTNDASCQFWLKVREVFDECKLRILDGDEGFYFRHDENCSLEGMVSIHVDDFLRTGIGKFLEEITSKIAQKLEISKLEYNEFRFTGMDVKKDGDVIVVSMEDYAKSLKKIEIRKGMPYDHMTEI